MPSLVIRSTCTGCFRARRDRNSWQEEYPPENCLDPRNENGWSPSSNTKGRASDGDVASR